MLQPPALVVLLVLASLVAVILHLPMGRSVRDLILFWLASLAGCVGGHLLGAELDLIPWTLGQVRITEASLGAILFVLAAAWLRPPQKEQRAPKK